MSTSLLEKQIKELPDAYINLVSEYVQTLYSKTKKINSLQGSLSKYANDDLRLKEKDAWKNQMVKKS